MTLAWPTDMPRCLDYPTTGIDAVLAGLLARTLTELRCKTATLNSPSPSCTTVHSERPGIACTRGPTGDVVALHMANNLWYVVAYYGALCAGAAVAPVNPTLPPAGLRDQLDDVKARVVISTPNPSESFWQRPRSASTLWCAYPRHLRRRRPKRLCRRAFLHSGICCRRIR
ncbi:hypothetical protein GCM10020255_106310 [Rhodococcus baikonurensis]